MSCLLPIGCISIGLGFLGLEMALEWGLVGRNGGAKGDIVKFRSAAFEFSIIQGKVMPMVS